MNIRLLFPALPALVLFSGCGKEPPPAEPPPPAVEVIETKGTEVPVYREIVATLQGTVNTSLKARVEGYLLTQEYEDGSLVGKGDLLFTIDPDPFEIAVQKAAADVAQAEAQLVKTQLDVTRDRELIKADAVSQRQLDNAVQAEQAAQAQVKAAKAALANARLNLGYCKVYSPVTGIAGKAQAGVGDLVGRTSVLTTISSLDPVQVVFFVPERSYLERAGDFQKALSVPYNERPDNLDLILADGTTFPHKGRLQFINRQIEEGTGTIGIYALFPNPGSVLRPGQYVKIRGRMNTLDDAILIPQRAVRETQGMFSVFIVNKDDTVSSVPVELGETKGSRVVVSSGLKSGQTVVAEGIQRLKNGAKVRTRPWSPDDKAGSGGDPAAGADAGGGRQSGQPESSEADSGQADAPSDPGGSKPGAD
ncbi:MAG: efflux RND transporter periplasmic adaptor subunit [Puniceicoccaceae bacterium]